MRKQKEKKQESRQRPVALSESQFAVAAVVTSASAMASTLIFWFVFATFTSQATASHFRGGIITWKPDGYIPNKVKTKIIYAN